MIRCFLVRVLLAGGPLLASGWLLGCERPSKSPPSTRVRAPETPRREALTRLGPTEVVPAAAVPTRQIPKLPEGLKLGEFYEKTMPGDRNLRVAHSRAETQRAIVYLHGMCGNSRGADRFEKLLTEYASVVVVRANIPCEDRPGFRWPQEPELIESRIAAALAVVREERAGQLDVEQPVLFGYSQGAHRAEKLAQAYPERYRTLVLGGPPTAPDPAKMPGVDKVVVIVGELEDSDHMIAGYEAMTAAGRNARLYTLPGAHHGDYGASGNRVVGEVFRWLFPEG